MADVTAVLEYDVDLERGYERRPLPVDFGSGDDLAHTIIVTAHRGKTEVDLAGIEVLAYINRADNATVLLTGTVENGKALIHLTESCYAINGRVWIVVKFSDGDTRSTVLWLEGNINRTSNGAVVDPEELIPSIDELLVQIKVIEDAVERAEAAADRAENAGGTGGTGSGTPGADGFSPIATVTQTDDGAVITITDKTGTTTATIANGAPGPKGDSYTLTDADKTAIAQEAAGLLEENDPTVPAWAKASTKPTYTAAEVGALPSTYTPPNQTAAQVGADPVGTAASKVSTHNADEDAHPAIRQLISDLSGRLNALADSDDTTLDQLSEIVAYIKSNKSLIDSITTGKVSTADIVNNLTSTATNKPLSAAQGKALKALIDAIVVPTKLSELAEDTTHRVVTDAEKTAWNAKSTFSGAYADLTGKPTIPTKISQLENDAGYVSSIMPDYIAEEAERVSAAVSAVRTSKSLVLLCASDIHTLMTNAQSVETTLHLAQGISEICKRIAVDGIAILGDSAFGSSTSTAEETKFAFAHLRENLAKGAHEIWIPGNHDHLGIGTDSDYLSADELYSYIGANTTDKAVTDYDNLHRMYGYVDYDKQRIRVIYLNTSDITDSYASDYGMTTVQAQWFADTLAAVPSGWGAVVMSHHPLNGYISAYLGTLTILDAYKGKESGSVTVGGGTVTYDFTDAQGEFICHLHGHIHNYQVKWLGDNGILSVTIPNGYFWRNNEYGTGGNTDWGDEVDGEQRVIDKTAGTAEDTAYTAVVIDRKGGKVYALRCGAGVDRVWDYVNGVEVDGETPDVPVEPDEPDTPTAGYTNQIPISVDTSGNVYNETGYKAGYRISTSAGTESAASGMTVTGYIPLPNTDSVVRVKDIDLTSSNSTFGLYSDAFVYGGGGYCSSTFGAADANGVRSYQVSTSAKYIRISGAFGDNPIITVDEEIG